MGVPNLPKCRVPVSSSYRAHIRTPGITLEGIPVLGVYLSGRTELTEVSGSGIEIVQNLPKYRVPVSNFTELAEVSGTGIETVPNKHQYPRYCD